MLIDWRILENAMKRAQGRQLIREIREFNSLWLDENQEPLSLRARKRYEAGVQAIMSRFDLDGDVVDDLLDLAWRRAYDEIGEDGESIVSGQRWRAFLRNVLVGVEKLERLRRYGRPVTALPWNFYALL